jgi:hypothetical protein
MLIYTLQHHSRDPDKKQREFCSIINFMLREDKKGMACHIAMYVATVNPTLVQKRGDIPQSICPHPEKVYRGGGMPHIHLGFFTAGKKYRVPGFLSTSMKENVAHKFMTMAYHNRNEPCILWSIAIHKNCMHVNYVGKTHVGTEEEYLFAPFSPFKVVKVSCVFYRKR